MIGLATHANYRTDPTQTTVVRAQFAAGMRRRYGELRRRLTGYVEENEERLRAGLFFVDEFMAEAERAEVEIVEEGNEAAWMAPFVVAGFVRGLRHADEATGFKGVGVRPIMLDGVLNYQAEIDVIQARNFRLLKNIDEVMNLQIKHELTRGILEGLNPRVVGRLVADRVNKIGRTRGELIARTETIRAHAEATLLRFEQYGIDSVSGQAEFRTARDERVCPICQGLDGTVYSLAEARGIIPVHPRCRCVWLPVIPGWLQVNRRRYYFNVPAYSWN